MSPGGRSNEKEEFQEAPLVCLLLITAPSWCRLTSTCNSEGGFKKTKTKLSFKLGVCCTFTDLVLVLVIYYNVFCMSVTAFLVRTGSDVMPDQKITRRYIKQHFSSVKVAMSRRNMINTNALWLWQGGKQIIHWDWCPWNGYHKLERFFLNERCPCALNRWPATAEARKDYMCRSREIGTFSSPRD